MDNYLQIEEILKFHRDLIRQGLIIDENRAAMIWIEYNAERWRSSHQAHQ